MRHSGCKLDILSGVASFLNDFILMPLFGKTRELEVVRATNPVVLPATTESIISVTVPPAFGSQLAVIEPHAATENQSFLVAKALVIPRGRRTVCRILNVSQQPLHIRKGMVLATIS